MILYYSGDTNRREVTREDIIHSKQKNEQHKQQ